MRFGNSLSNECFKNTVIKTQLLIPVFAGQAEDTRDCLWWFFSEPTIFIWAKRDVFVYLLCFLVVRSMLMFVYLILNGFSVYLSSSGISQGLQMSRVFFPNMPTHLCMCVSSICVLTHTFMPAEGKITSIYLPGSATEQYCKSKLRTGIFCVNGKINPRLKLRWLGGGWTSTSEQPAAHVNIWIQSSLTKCVVGLFYLEPSEHGCRDHRPSGITLNAVAMPCCSCLEPW